MKPRLITAVAPLALFALSLLAPPAAARGDDDIVELAVSDGRFGTLVSAVSAAGLVEALQDDGPLTVFAPTDEAFAKLDPALLKRLLEPAGRAALTQILTYHVVAGRVDAAAALAAERAATLEGDEVTIALRDGRLRVNDAVVLANDVDASNGVIHVIDSVLLPPDLELPPVGGRPVIGIYDATPSRALASQLRFDRGEARLIERLVSGGGAEAAGLRAYDILLEVDGEPCSDAALKAAKQRVGVGGTLTLLVLREGQRHEFDVTVGSARH